MIRQAADNMTEYAASDLEGTLSAGEGWRAIGEYLKTHGRKNAHRMFIVSHLVPVLTVRLGWADRQEFRNRWLRDQAALLKGYSTEELDTLADWVVEHELWSKRRESVIGELAHHHSAGRTIVIASAAYEPVARALARRLNWERVIVVSTPLEMANGRATGKLAGAIGVGELKADKVKQAVGGGKLVAAYGDTAPDIPMLSLSAEPVAVAPDDALRAYAKGQGWRVIEN